MTSELQNRGHRLSALTLAVLADKTIVAAAAVLGACFVFLRLASYGPGMPGDAVNYVLAARNFLAGDGLVGWDDVLVHAPLYPLLLAGGGLFGLDPYVFAGPLNVVVFGLTVLVAGWWLRGRLQSRFLWLWGCLSIALALPLVETASLAMTDSVFVLLVTFSLTQIDAHLRGAGRACLVRAAVFTALACLTRHIGISLLLTVVAMLLAASMTAREKMKRVAVYGLIAGVPPAFFTLPILLAVGSATGGADRGFYSFSLIADEVLRIVVGDWWLVGLTLPVLAALLTAAVAAGHAFVRRSFGDGPLVAWGPLRVLGGFVLAYVALLAVAMGSGASWDGLPERYLAPVYVPLLSAALLVLDSALRYARKHVPLPGRGGVAAVSVILTLTLALQSAWLVVQHGTAVRLWADGGYQGFGGPAWRESESLQYIREAGLTGVILSNSPFAPILHAAGSERRFRLMCELRRPQSSPNDGRLYFLHLNHYRDRTSGCSRQQDDDLLRRLPRVPWLAPVAELADGKLYREREPYEIPPAMFRGFEAPAEGVGFGVQLVRSRERRRGTWRWEKDTETDGWTSLSVQPPTHTYIPTADDVGQRLRAYAHYEDRDGNLVKAVTEPSPPVQPRPVSVWLGAGEGTSAAAGTGGDRLLDGRPSPPASGEPAARDAFDVHVGEGRVVVVKDRCTAEDTVPWFFVHVTPSASDDLPDDQKPHGFDNTAFSFQQSGVREGGTCIAVHALPEYDVAEMRVGQWTPEEGELWSSEVSVRPGTAEGTSVASGPLGDLGARSRWEMFLHGNRLIYVHRNCVWEDEYGARFPLNVWSLDADSGIPERDALDFGWHESFWQNDGTCVAERRLPDKDIVAIQARQVDGTGNLLWEKVHWLGENRRLLDALPRPASGEPAVGGAFDVHVGEGRAVFVKDRCTADDTEFPFFMHVRPAAAHDLPDDRKPFGFDNFVFSFQWYDIRAGGACIVLRALPEYDIADIRVGQWVPTEGDLWSAEISAP